MVETTGLDREVADQAVVRPSGGQGTAVDREEEQVVLPLVLVPFEAVP